MGALVPFTRDKRKCLTVRPDGAFRPGEQYGIARARSIQKKNHRSFTFDATQAKSADALQLLVRMYALEMASTGRRWSHAVSHLQVRMLDCTAAERAMICSAGSGSTVSELPVVVASLQPHTVPQASRVVAFLSSWTATTPRPAEAASDASPQLTDLWVEFLLKVRDPVESALVEPLHG